MRRIKVMLLLAIAAVLLPITVWAGPKVIKYAHFQPAKLDQPKHAAALAFKNYVESNTKGSVKVEVYPASQLGDGPAVLEGLKMGTIEMGVVHDGPIPNIFKPFMLYAIPYLFDDQPMAWAVADGPFGQELAEAMRKATGIRMFTLGDNGIRHFFNSKKPIVTPADMKGMKIRVMPGPIWMKLVSSLGASPTPVPWPELPAALQQGVADGAECGVTNILAASLYQSQKYIVLDGHVYSWHAYLMNDRFYNTLTPEEQKVVRQGVEIAKIIHRGMCCAQDMNAPTILSGLGMKVQPLTPEQVGAFRKVAQPPVIQWVVEQVGQGWVDKTFAAVKAYKKDH
jgi:tripartite ATP-independent transporter DctP family solute receptor